MKELSIEEKAKRYDEVVAKLRYAFNSNRCTLGFMNEILRYPKESKDERIRKSLIILLQHFCKGYRVPGLDFPVSYKDMLAWLEKQGKVVNEICKENDDSLTNEDEKIRKALIEYFNEQCDMSDWNGVYGYQVVAWLKTQGEHKKFRDSIQVGDEVTRNSDGVIVNLSQLKRVAKKGQQKLPIEKLPEEMKTIGESLGFTTQEECDEYNQMVSDLIMSDNNKEEQKQNVDNKKLTDVNHEYFSELLKNDKSDNIADYAYQCVYCMSHDWAIENPTWDNVQSACRLGAKWQKKHDVSKDWNEEDEQIIGKIRSIVEKYAFSQSAVDVNGELCEKEYIDADNWLKSIKNRVIPRPEQEWKQENTDDLTDLENAMMHIGESFFGNNAGLDPNDTNAIKEQANTLLGLVPSKEWSEEDEERIKNILSVLDVQVCWNGATGKKENTYQKEIDWLKSLKPKSWTKEDKERYISCLQRLGSGNPEQSETINSKWFKEHVYPQSQWKQSDEQMEALYEETQKSDRIRDERIVSLYNDLKRLKE